MSDQSSKKHTRNTRVVGQMVAQVFTLAAGLSKDAEKVANQLFMTAHKVIKAVEPAADNFVYQVTTNGAIITSRLSKDVEFAIQAAAPIAAVVLEEIQKDPAILVVVVAGLSVGSLLSIIIPYILRVLGFSSKGVVAGSIAARIQSSFGGKIDAGSAFAIAQSIATGGDIPASVVQSAIGVIGLSIYVIALAIKRALDDNMKASGESKLDIPVKTKL